MIDETAPLPPTVYVSSRRRTLLLLLGAVGFVAAGAVMLTQSGSVFVAVVGAVSVSFFGLCAVAFTARLVRNRPELVLDGEGLEHVQLGRIAWGEIAGVRPRVLSGQVVIEVVLYDPAGYTARAPRIVRMSAGANRALGFGPANISANTLPVGPEAVLSAMVRHHPRLAVR